MKQKIFLLLSLTLFIVSFGQILFNLLQILPRKNFIDFFVYNGAVEKFVNQQNPYNFLYGQPPDKVPFNYPPSALLVLLPLKLFPLKTAQIILVMLSFLAFWLTFWVILKMSKIRLSLPRFLTLLAFFNQTFPVKFTLVLGQINLVVLGLSFGALYFYFRSTKKLIGGAGGSPSTTLRVKGGLSRATVEGETRDRIYQFFSIMFFSFASSLKIFPLFTLPLFFLLKDFKFVFSVLGIFLTLNLLPSFNLFKQYYFQIVPNLSRSVGIPNFYDQSLLAFLLRLGVDVSLAKIVWFFFLTTVFTFALFSFYRRLKNNIAIEQFSNLALKQNKFASGQAIKHFSLIFALFSIGNLFSWQHHLVFAYPLVFIVYLKTLERQKNLKGKLFYNLLFLFIWLFFVFHFKTETSPYLSNPFIASHQTIAVLFFIAYSLIRS